LTGEYGPLPIADCRLGRPEGICRGSSFDKHRTAPWHAAVAQGWRVRPDALLRPQGGCSPEHQPSIFDPASPRLCRASLRPSIFDPRSKNCRFALPTPNSGRLRRAWKHVNIYWITCYGENMLGRGRQWKAMDGFGRQRKAAKGNGRQPMALDIRRRRPCDCGFRIACRRGTVRAATGLRQGYAGPGRQGAGFHLRWAALYSAAIAAACRPGEGARAARRDGLGRLPVVRAERKETAGAPWGAPAVRLRCVAD